MGAKKNWFKLTLAIVGVLLLIGFSSAQAATVLTDSSGTAYAIRDLNVPGQALPYNVDFLVGTYGDVYDNPPTFDFDNLSVQGAIAAVNDILTDEEVSSVGEEDAADDYGIYGIGTKFENNFVEWRGGLYSRVKDEWIDDIQNNPIGGFVDAEQTWIWADFTPVPIPATAWLLGAGLIGLLGIRRRYKR